MNKVAASVSPVFGAVVVAVVSAALTASLVRRFRVAGVLDEVGDRSSHAVPTPRGGGVAFVVAASLGWILAACLQPQVSGSALVGLCSASGAVALVGLVDDLRGSSPLVRLAVHLAASAAALWIAVGLHPGSEGLLWLAGTVALAWFVNAFNFMDGTDAFAATHGCAIAGLLSVLLWGHADRGATALAMAVPVVAGLVGFLPFNWPRARIFMGDVGSGWIGLSTGLLLVVAWKVEPRIAAAGLAWLSPFVMDPTVCLVRRAIRRERIWQAHRSHGFQNLARKLGSHGRLLAAWWIVMFVAYLPLAMAASRAGWWPWVPIAAVLGVIQALALRSGVRGVAE